MEAKNVRTITAIMLLMLLLAGQASASFKTCFESCALGCFLAKDKSKCLLKCTIKCVVGINSTATGLDYCKLGCAVHQCARFRNDVDKVDSCVNECEVGKCSLLSQSKGIASQVSRTPSAPIRAPSPKNSDIAPTVDTNYGAHCPHCIITFDAKSTIYLAISFYFAEVQFFQQKIIFTTSTNEYTPEKRPTASDRFQSPQIAQIYTD
ncbi:protein TAP1-like [Forsythia ovata]|uniref:Protein TAP1-like n=1 Tax=Forsythia ovata TaxID=205694 RepID=A0ABD1TUY2_9LAMI